MTEALQKTQFRDVILFNSPWTHPADGWAIASRTYARAMHLAGLDVTPHDWQRPENHLSLDHEVEREMRDLLDTRPATLSMHIFSAPLVSAELMGSLDVMLENPEPQALYCVFERRYIEPELVEKMNRLRGIWVQCRMNEQVLKQAGVKNVTLIPYPFFDDDPHLRIEKPSREPRRFYNIGRFEPRKAPDNIIRAFLRAFAPGESELFIKTSPIAHITEYLNFEEFLQAELDVQEVRANGWTLEKIGENVRIASGMFSRERMLELHASSDVYVSASRGEGLELGAWAAKLAGRRLIVTASGGPEDFLDPQVDICIPATGLVPADPSYPWGPGANYIDYRLNDLVAAMQQARAETNAGTLTWPGWEEHRAKKVGKKLAEWIQGIIGD